MANTKVKAEQLEAAQTNITSVGTLTGLDIGANSHTGADPAFGISIDVNDYVAQFANTRSTAGQAYGVRILAGTNSSDSSLYVRNKANDTDYFMVRGDGNVGIGTASPAAALHIEVADNTEFLKATITGNEAWAFKGASGSGVTDYVSFGISGGTQAMTWQEDGKVGIGDTTPQALLDVGGGYGGNTTVATFAHATDAYIEIENMTTQHGAGIILTNAGTKKWTIQKDTSAHSLHIQDASGDVMTFLQGGKIGLGTGAPDTHVHISTSDRNIIKFHSSYSPARTYYFRNDNGMLCIGEGTPSDSRDLLNLDTANKRVGIQTKAPVVQLVVYDYDGDNSQMQFQTSSTGQGAANGARFGYNGDGAQIWNFQNNYVRFATNNVERVRINNLGYLGIAFTNPLYPLDATGSGEIQGRFKSTGDTGYTQGAIVIESSDSTSSPQDRGQGVYMFNHGTDKTWYMGTTYADAGTFQISVVGGSTLQKSAASNGSAQAALRINSSRHVIMGSSSHADDVLYVTRSDAGKLLRFYQGGSEVGYIGTTSGTTSLPSDKNFKKDINDLNLGLDFVKSLNPKTFRLKIEENDSPLSIGLIAQEIEESLTQAGITKNSLGFLQHKPNEDAEQSQYWINNESLIPILINAIQELSAKLEAK